MAILCSSALLRDIYFQKKEKKKKKPANYICIYTAPFRKIIQDSL